MKQLTKATMAAALAATTAPCSYAAGPAFSGIFASANNAETVYNNPAGMTRLDGTQMTAQAILIVPVGSFEVDEDLTTVDGGNPRDSNPSFVPALYYSRQFREDWRFGISIDVPTGFGSNNGPNWAGRYYNDEFSRSTLPSARRSPTS